MAKVVRLVINSSDRNTTRFPTSADFEVDLRQLEIQNVYEVKRAYAAIPIAEPHVTAGRDRLYIRTEEGQEIVARLPWGRYPDVKTLAYETTNAIRAATQRLFGDQVVFRCYVGTMGRLFLTAPLAFCVRTREYQESKHVDGHPYHRMLNDSAARVLGFSSGTVGESLATGEFWASPTPIDLYAVPAPCNALEMDEAVIVRVEGMSAQRSNNPVIDRSFAVLHEGRQIDALPTVHHSNPKMGSLTKLHVRLFRMNGDQFDTNGHDVTLHMDMVLSDRHSS